MSDPVEIVARFLASELSGHPTEPNNTHRDVARELLTELYANRWRIIQTNGYLPGTPNGWVIDEEWKPTEPARPTACGGFVWIGQPFTSCDRCGQPAWEHQGLDQPPDDPFSDAPSTVRSWKPGEAEAIRSKWETTP